MDEKKPFVDESWSRPVNWRPSSFKPYEKSDYREYDPNDYESCMLEFNAYYERNYPHTNHCKELFLRNIKLI